MIDFIFRLFVLCFACRILEKQIRKCMVEWGVCSSIYISPGGERENRREKASDGTYLFFSLSDKFGLVFISIKGIEYTSIKALSCPLSDGERGKRKMMLLNQIKKKRKQVHHSMM